MLIDFIKKNCAMKSNKPQIQCEYIFTSIVRNVSLVIKFFDISFFAREPIGNVVADLQET